MSTSNHSQNGSNERLQSTTTAQKKPLTVSLSDDVSLQIETVSGKLVNPTAPTAESIGIKDIAWALSRIPRFAGHTITEIPYNVAQHSVYVSELIDSLFKHGINFADTVEDFESILQAAGTIGHMNGGNYQDLLIKALIHDAHEAYIGDIPSPIKKIPELHETFKLIEMRLDHAILSKLGLDAVTENERRVIKWADKLAQAIEGYQFMPSRGLNWALPKPSLTLLQKFPAPMSPLESYELFLNRYEYLLEDK